MDQNQQGQPAQEAHGNNHYQSNPVMAPTTPPTQTSGPSAPSSYPRHQQQQQQLNSFWAKQCQEIEESTDLGTHSLPLARIKKIMKADGDVRMISAETPVLFSKACEMFIMELTMRAWANAEESKMRTLHKCDIASAITRSDVFDFLVDTVPREDTTECQVFAGNPRTGTAPTENVAYHTPPHQQHDACSPYDIPRMVMRMPVLNQNHNGLQTHPSPTAMRPNPEQQNNNSLNSDD